jgi:ABC-type antimicrobial peptide transport system permease subunit
MNTLAGFDADDASSVGVFLKDRRRAQKDMLRFQSVLAEKIQSAPPIINAQVWDDFKPERGITVYVLTLSIYLQPLNELLEAINALNYLLYAMLLLIILASAAVTYRLILNDRVKEMGVMRAIGFYEYELRRILMMEAAVLGALSAAAGFLLALTLSKTLSLIPLSQFPSFEILLSNGSLGAVFSPLAVLTNIAALYITLFFAVSVPAFRVSKMALPQMLSGGAKG